MRRSYHSNLAFLDILFNTLLCFVAFFALALIYMKKEEATTHGSPVEFEAFVMIIASWPEKFGDDIDLYVMGPDRSVIFFQNKNNSIMHLDRDDLGREGVMVDEDDDFHNNREVVTVRRKQAGQFVVNLHAYGKISPDPVPVNIKVYKINNGTVLVDRVLIFDYQNQEKTACRFTVERNGNITNINNLFMPIANDIVRSAW